MAHTLRVADLARTMGISSTELVFKLRSIGVTVAGEEDQLDLGTVRAIITGETLQKRPREVIVRTDAAPEETPATTARDRLAKRRRRTIPKTDREIAEVAVVSTKLAEADDAEIAEMAAAAEAAEAEVAEVEVAEAEVAEAEIAEAEVAEAEVAEDAETVEVAEAEVAETVVEEAPAEADVEAAAADEAPVETEGAAEVAEAEEEAPAAVETETPVAVEETKTAAEAKEPEVHTEDPGIEISEEELTSERETSEEEPQRVRPKRALTPLEQGLRELSPDEIKQRLQTQRDQEKKRKERGPTGGKGVSRKAKSAADAREIRDLLSKFEEQKLKSQQEPSGAPGSRPGPRRAPVRPGGRRRTRRRRDTSERPAPPRPNRTIHFKDDKKPEGPIILSEMVTPRELAEKLNITVKDLLALLIQNGVMVTTNQSLPHELAEQICTDLEVEAMVASVEEVIDYEREESEEPAGPLVPRPPVVTVMGHVDHGKTSVLDALRSSRVAEQEAGGITQHIGASRVQSSDGRWVVFVDTPGHEAFTHMRARGAQITDIVVLVVAADDGVMPQTIEAINHARAAGVPLIVAINKIDKANANPERVKQQLAEQEILVEDWGGEVPSVPVSAKTGDGITDVLDMIMLVADMKDLKAPESGAARGVVLEARKEKGRGIVATLLVHQGTLKVGDYFFCGSTWGRVRALSDDQEQRIDSAGPAVPCEVTGFDGVPGAGDRLQVVESEDSAAEVATYRSQLEKEKALTSRQKVSLENLFDRMSEDEVKRLNVVIKADVQGSVEVLRATLDTLSTDKVKLNVLHGSVGAVTTNDVMLASASEAIVIGFAVRPERPARDLAEVEQVDIRLYTVIYDLVDDIRKAMVGLLEPEYEEEEMGQAEVREIFRVPKIGSIAGCRVLTGLIKRTSKVRLLRDNVVIFEGELASLRHFKDDVKEVRQGFECGIGLERFQDIKVGDVIEAYKIIEIAPEL